MLSQLNSSHRKQFRAWVNSVKRHRSPLPPILDSSGEVISDNSIRAEIFNHHFYSVFTKEDCSNLYR